MPPPSGLSTLKRPPSTSTRSARPISPVPLARSAPPAPSSRDLHHERLLLRRDAHADRTRLRVARRVGERLRRHEVRAARDGQRQLALVHVDLDRHLGGLAQRRQRLAEPALAQRHRVQAARELAQLGVRLAELLLGAGDDVVHRVVLVELHARHAQQVRDREQPLLGAVVQVAPDAAALLVGRLDDPRAGFRQRARLVAPLELRRGARREDPQRRGVLLARLHWLRVEHRDVPEVHVLGGAQADRDVALQAEVDRDLGAREALLQRLRERHPRVVGHDRARRAGGVVLERLLDERAVVPGGERGHVHAGGVGGLADQHHLGRERLRDIAGQAAQELVADRTRGALGNRRQELVTSKPTGGKGRGHVLDRSSIERPRRSGFSHAMCARRRCHPHATRHRLQPVKPDRPAPDPLRHGSIALLSVLEGLPDATVGANRDGTIVFVNELAEKQFGYTREELLGQPIEILWPERVRDRYRANLELYFELEHPLRFTERAYGRRKDGPSSSAR